VQKKNDDSVFLWRKRLGNGLDGKWMKLPRSNAKGRPRLKPNSPPRKPLFARVEWENEPSPAVLLQKLVDIPPKKESLNDLDSILSHERRRTALAQAGVIAKPQDNQKASRLLLHPRLHPDLHQPSEPAKNLHGELDTYLQHCVVGKEAAMPVAGDQEKTADRERHRRCELIAVDEMTAADAKTTPVVSRVMNLLYLRPQLRQMANIVLERSDGREEPRCSYWEMSSDVNREVSGWSCFVSSNQRPL